MHLESVINGVSPDTKACVRTTGVMLLDSGEKLHIWVDVPERLSNAISITGNPWLVAMLPLAASQGEDIRLTIPVDALLLENLRGVLAAWRVWYPDLHEVAITCPVASHVPDVNGAEKTAAFFSGGIDSYFTIGRRLPGNPHGLPVVGRLDDLLTVWGFDVGVYDEAEFLPMVPGLTVAAERLGFSHAVVRTNLREHNTVFRRRWGPLTFGAGLAFIGLILERRYKEVVLGSSYPFGSLVPWGSHPMIDPLFSSSSLRICHDGASFTRIGKTAIVAMLPEAAATLHVCQAVGVGNCSRCEKCYRTMVALDMLGQKDRFLSVFDWSDYRVENIRKIYMGGGLEQVFYQEMLVVALAGGRGDIAAAIGHASRRSSRLKPLLQVAQMLTAMPGLWRLGVLARRGLLRHSISQRYIKHGSRNSSA